MKWGVLFFLLGSFCLNVTAQFDKDSLERVVARDVKDSNTVKSLIELTKIYSKPEPDSAIMLAEQALELSKQLKYERGTADSYYWLGDMAKLKGEVTKIFDYLNRSLQVYEQLGDCMSVSMTLNNLGMNYNTQGKYDKAMKYFERSKNIATSRGDKKVIAGSYINMGRLFEQKGDIPVALEYYHKSLKLREEIGNKEGIASAFNIIGMLYYQQKDIETALEYFNKSLIIKKEMGDKKGMATTYSNLGAIKNAQGDLDGAFDYFKKALKTQENIGDKFGMAATYNNIGFIHNKMGDREKGLEYYHKSLKLKEELNNPGQVASAHSNVGSLYFQMEDYANAMKHGKISLEMSQNLGFPIIVKKAAELLTKVHRAKGNWEEAFSMYLLHIKMRDSLDNDANEKAAIQEKLQYKFEKVAAADSVKHAEAEKVMDAQIQAQSAKLKKEQTQKYALGGGLGLMLVLALVVFRSYRQKKKDNEIINQQKVEVDHAYEILEEKNQEITDSITYAQRIQEAILPPDRIVKEYLKESFIYYKPKDIVAGDFYWMDIVPDVGEQKEETILFAAADCTGHGVPGAMVSVVCHNALNRAVREFKLTEPGKILDKVRELVIETFEKSDHEVKDGMDIALCSLTRSTLLYAGANNPLWVYRKGMTDIEELEETKPDKQPIGKFGEPEPFTTHTLQLKAGDSFYIFTDGYPDQFGGPKGKKFKYKPFKQLLLDGLASPMEDQRTTIGQHFESWRGELEQVDDVCVIGVRV